MKELDKTNLSQAKFTRAIRIGNTFYYADNYSEIHEDLAYDAGASDAKDGKPIVDDGGWLEHDDDGVLHLVRTTTSCKIKGDANEAREISNNLLLEIQS